MDINQTNVNNSISEEGVVSNNVVYNSPFLVLNNNGKSGVNLIPTSMVGNNCNVVAVSNQNPVMVQNMNHDNQNITDNKTNQSQVASLTPSQLQSLSFLLQSQLSPQFIQTANGLVQIIPQMNTATVPGTHNQSACTNNQIDWQQSNNLQGQFTIGSQQQGAFQIGNMATVPQLIPIQQIVTDSNGAMYITSSAVNPNGTSSDLTNNVVNHQNTAGQIVSSIIDLNSLNVDQQSQQQLTGIIKTEETIIRNTNNNLQQQQEDIENNGNKKKQKKKRKKGNKLEGSKELQSINTNEISLPTSSNEISKEPAESSDKPLVSNDAIVQYDNKGRPFTFFCNVCPKKFTLNSRLTAHMRCHTGMRPFTCGTCGFSFTQKSYLIRHAAVHKEERPFHCEKCQKSYKHYGSLANHRKLHKKEMYQNVSSIEDNCANNMNIPDVKNVTNIINQENHINTSTNDAGNTINTFIDYDSTINSVVLDNSFSNQLIKSSTANDEFCITSNEMIGNDSTNYALVHSTTNQEMQHQSNEIQQDQVYEHSTNHIQHHNSLVWTNSNELIGTSNLNDCKNDSDVIINSEILHNNNNNDHNHNNNNINNTENNVNNIIHNENHIYNHSNNNNNNIDVLQSDISCFDTNNVKSV